ncbi:MAG: SDR family NAD(P)-dependent oxidoreductase [Halioglobus sp.]
MKNLKDKTAVITGGASGIGYSLAKKALAEGMRVVIADLDQAALNKAADSLGGGEKLLAVATDVSNSAAIDALATAARAQFGAVHLLCNNAGVGGGGPLWEQSEEEWDFVLGVNLKGVTNGVRAFTPGMIAQGEGHIVNTASIAGLVSAVSTSTYTVSKHAVVALSEVLLGDLQAAEASVGVSVLCPSFVNTNIYKVSDQRPGGDDSALTDEQRKELKAVEAMIEDFFKTALSPDEVANMVFEAVVDDQFYILTHPEGSRVQIEERLQGILSLSAPAIVPEGQFPQS